MLFEPRFSPFEFAVCLFSNSGYILPRFDLACQSFAERDERLEFRRMVTVVLNPF
jgi:hypothetical protein